MCVSVELVVCYDVCLYIYLVEIFDEEDFCLQCFGLCIVDYLDSVGWFGLCIWLVYGIYFNVEEICCFGEVGIGICYCLSLNMCLVLGICLIVELEVVGVLIGLGVDGLVFNDVLNMIFEVCQVLYL